MVFVGVGFRQQLYTADHLSLAGKGLDTPSAVQTGINDSLHPIDNQVGPVGLESYDAEMIRTAMNKDRSSLIQSLRTHNMYPPGVYTERIADAIVEMFQPGASTSAELFFEERDLFVPVEEEAVDEAESSADDKGMDVDDLLEDDIEDDFEEKGIIKNLKKNIKTSDSDASIDDA
jgi:hypothetical protein